MVEPQRPVPTMKVTSEECRTDLAAAANFWIRRPLEVPQLARGLVSVGMIYRRSAPREGL